jgi:glycosyltransferase involved in cell wall biosynthesis
MSNKVSILIPAYKPNWLDETIASALGQNHPSIEVIVTDDCPSDAVRDVCSKYGGAIRYLRNPKPDGIGLNNAFLAMSLAQGDFIKFLFDDDLLSWDCCSVLCNALVENPRCSMAFSARQIIDSDGRKIGSLRPLAESGYIDSREAVRQMVLRAINYIGEPTTVMFRRSDLANISVDRIFEFNGKSAKALVDVALYLNLCTRGSSFYYSVSELSSFRKSSLQNSVANTTVRRLSVSEWMDALIKARKTHLVTQSESDKAAEKFLVKWLNKYTENLELQTVVKNAVEFYRRSCPGERNDIGGKQCYLCKELVSGFLPFNGGRQNISPVIRALRVIGSDVDNYLCPKCRCNDRERHLALYLDQLAITEKIFDADILHVSPERRLTDLIRAAGPRAYRCIDLRPTRAGVEKMDLQALDLPANSFDFVICNHVLEHVADPSTALSEIYRVLRPGGCAVLQTPWSPLLSSTFEAKVECDDDRALLFGQNDHVRVFGADLMSIISRAGLTPIRYAHSDVLPHVDGELFGVNIEEDLVLGLKPEVCDEQ